MLKGIAPLLGPELLHALAAMGHGDDIAVVDANFPADALAKRLIRLDGHDAISVLTAILSVLPVDDFSDDPLRTMAVVGGPDRMPAIVTEFEAIASVAESRPMCASALAREQFYRSARLYGNLLIRRGVVYPG